MYIIHTNIIGLPTYGPQIKSKHRQKALLHFFLRVQKEDQYLPATSQLSCWIIYIYIFFSFLSFFLNFFTFHLLLFVFFSSLILREVIKIQLSMHACRSFPSLVCRAEASNKGRSQAGPMEKGRNLLFSSEVTARRTHRKKIPPPLHCLSHS